MPSIPIHRLQRSGAILLASYVSATLGCAAPYEPEGQYWATAPSVSLGAGSDDPAADGTSGDATGATEATPPDDGTSGDPRLDEDGTSIDTRLDNGAGGGSVPPGAANAADTSNGTDTSNAAATQGSGGSSAGAGSATAGAGGATAEASGTGAVISPGVGADSPTCSLSVSVTTTAPGDKYKPRNVGAVWVADSSGKFLKSLEVWGNKRLKAVKAWTAATNAAGLNGSKVDAVTSATLSAHRAHELTWDCRDARAQVMPDNTYRVYFEVADDDSGGPNHFEAFTKGPATATVEGSATNFNNIVLTFTP